MGFGRQPFGTFLLPFLGEFNLELCALLFRIPAEFFQILTTVGLIDIADGAGPGVGEVVTGAPVGSVQGGQVGLKSLDQVLELHLAANGAGQLGADFAQFIFQFGEFRVEEVGTAQGPIPDGLGIIQGDGGGGGDGIGSAGDGGRHGG